jgi:hypothetical protein
VTASMVAAAYHIALPSRDVIPIYRLSIILLLHGRVQPFSHHDMTVKRLTRYHPSLDVNPFNRDRVGIDYSGAILSLTTKACIAGCADCEPGQQSRPRQPRAAEKCCASKHLRVTSIWKKLSGADPAGKSSRCGAVRIGLPTAVTISQAI